MPFVREEGYLNIFQRKSIKGVKPLSLLYCLLYMQLLNQFWIPCTGLYRTVQDYTVS